MFPEFTKVLPSFISLEQEKRETIMPPPTPPSRKSLYAKSNGKKSSKGSAIPSSSSSRHEKCFKRPESPVLGANKYGTITIRKSSRGPLCRSKSAGAVSSLLPRLAGHPPPQENRVTVVRKQNYLRAGSPLRKSASSSTQVLTSRHTSRSPVAFGRSISKERTFAEEKKRLENSLPLDRYTFEASTNILRDPALKSPQDVKKAVRSLATCAFQSRSRSVPRFCTGCRNHAGLESSYASRHNLCYPEVEHYGYTEWLRSPNVVSRANAIEKKRKVEKLPSAKQMSKALSNVSLAASNSTFSMGNTATSGQSAKPSDTKIDVERKICKKLAREASKTRKTTTTKINNEAGTTGNVEELSYVVQEKFPTNAKEDINQHQSADETDNTYHSSVRDKALFWNDFNMQQTASLPYNLKHQSSTYITHVSGHKSRSLSPNRKQFNREEITQSLPPATEVVNYDSTSEPASPKLKEFSPTREVRVPPNSTTRNVRSPSRRLIESCRTNQNNKVIRASSLSSAEDRSKRGLYLCDELAHSATSLASNDRHSPTCRYLHNSERFVELNRFYSTLERVGLLERATSKTDFKPIRKESELLDYDEWRRVRLHERAERELNYLVGKLKHDQHEKNLLFLPKDVEEVKWRKEKDLGLNLREKSVEDLREDFENINFLHDYLEQSKKPCSNMKYWRRNTVADLTHSLEEKIQNTESAALSKDMSFNEQLVNTLPNEQINKINRQLNEIYACEPKQAQTAKATEPYVVTVEHHNMPTSSQALKVRCKSSITRDELLGSILKRKEALSSISLKKRENQTPDSDKTIVNKSSDISEPNEPPEIPPAPKMEYKQETKQQQMSSAAKVTLARRDITPDITQKIKYFEERKYDKPPKTVYHAREDSSPDEDEVMRMIEEKMRLKQYRNGWHKHKELSTSLTDLCEMFGEKNSSRANFHLRSPQQRPPDEYHQEHHYQHDEVLTEMSEDCTPYSSLEFLESYCRSRSASPQSQCSSYLQRVNTGDVQKIRNKFESLNYNSLKTNHFFGLRKLRKVRSDPELNIIKSESKDALKNADVSWITHKFEMHNKITQTSKEETEPQRGRKRQIISPQPMTCRLMPRIDRISKTASLGACNKKHPPPSPGSQSPTRSLSSSSAIGKHSHILHSPHLNRKHLSLSSPDVRCVREYLPQYLTANWVAHRYPSPEHNKLKEDEERLRQGKHLRKTHSPVSRAPMPEAPVKSDDIFANQKFDPKIHQPKARYVPDGVPTKCHQARLQWAKTMPRRGNAVTFQVSPNRYYESDVNIHFKTPVRQEFKSPMSEEELALRQAEQMQKLYQEERRRKYLQELQDMNSRRHTDNFTPSQKSPIALNRYDDFPADLAPKPLNQSKSVARALYNFQAQNSKELSFKKGDIIFIRRAIDKNWYEGEHNAMIGLFPANYVEVINKDIMPIQVQHTTRSKPSEGQARAKYNFQAQSGVELSLNKGELVALTRRVDDNWFEGRVANRKGIFPVSYVEVLTDIGAEDIAAKTTTSQQQQQTNVINARPSLDTMRTNINNEFNTLTRNGVQAPNSILRETRTNQKTDFLHVDTSSEPLVYRALYKYRPQNSDELELLEGDIVHVLEKCDDGWYVGTSQRTGCFGTFPGNYVERL
ncbi:cbl-associated protein isoform X23 [Haematobia irritans]|uniref:cbl-associated protein isoform X23 n=1 Tax=Haematobia irritans TaxID=7368 RepID=UPI003F4F4D51